ncbi:MAG: hypothetical protein PWR01_3932 [Clostridiales bacterium]|jgi:anti-anti-sigma factor|nr:hypothetical protein [Clostridiales bacterium]MDN5282859.1 hypothetical protein [Candidatus Ozemobacter sp.]
MKIELVCQGSEGVITVSGTLNLHSLKDFDRQMRCLEFNGLSKVILDLAKLDHIDSSGVSGIIQLHRILADKNILMKIGNISNRVDRLFDQMRLFDIIPRV